MAREFLSRIQNKRDTSANWTKNNPVILNGEIILVDTAEGELRAKIGDGTKTYTQLPFSDEALKSLINTVANNVADNTAARHNHSNKDVLDKITGIITGNNFPTQEEDSKDTDIISMTGLNTGFNLFWENVGDTLVSYGSQSKTDEEKAIARDNIGALSTADTKLIYAIGKESELSLTDGNIYYIIENNVPLYLVSSFSQYGGTTYQFIGYWGNHNYFSKLLGKQYNTRSGWASDIISKDILIGTNDPVISEDSATSTEYPNSSAVVSYVKEKVASIVNSAPETLDTLNELATALGNDPNFATTMATELGNKVDKVTGKGLSTNDLTATLKANYDAAYTHSQSTHAPSNAERNVIVGIQKNGTDVSVNTSTRKVNITVPTKTSELTNDSSFITGPFLTEDEIDTICETAVTNASNLTY